MKYEDLKEIQHKFTNLENFVATISWSKKTPSNSVKKSEFIDLIDHEIIESLEISENLGKPTKVRFPKIQ